MEKNTQLSIGDVSTEMVITIRLLSSVPQEIETLLAEIAKQEEQLLG